MQLVPRPGRRKTAIRPGNDPFPPDYAGEPLDPLRDELRVLHLVDAMRHDAGNQDLVIGQLELVPDPPLVLVPRIGRLDGIPLGGQIDLTFFAFSSALRHVKAGKLRAIGVGGTKRNALLPEVPSISEVLPGYSATSWTALVATPGTPAPVAQKLSQAVSEIVKMPDVQKRLIDAGDESFDMTPAQIAVFLHEESERWGKLIKTVGITAQ